jgi:hypothetical protein
MAMPSKQFVWSLLMAVLMLLAVWAPARRLEGDKPQAGVATASGDHHIIINFLKHLYMQQLASAGSSRDI